jgi:regulator of sigma E protease
LGLRQTKEDFVRVLRFLGKLVTFRVSPKSLGGPLMIAAAAGSEFSQGIPRLLLFLTLLSTNLAILNFLPVPALDGGHMMFLTAEAVTGKPVDERLQGTLTLIGVVCLLGLMVFVFANDVGRLFL